MKIGFDASFAINDQTGVGRYSYNLIKYLLKIDRVNQYILFFNFFRLRAEKRQRINNLIGHHQNVKIVISYWPGKIKELFWQNPFISPLDIFFGELDIYQASCFQAFPKKTNSKNTVVTVHDLTYLINHGFHQLQADHYLKLTRQAVRNAKIIVADSQATRDDLLKYLGDTLPKIRVVYLGVEDKFKPAGKNTIVKTNARFTQGHDYILSVGTLEPRKNLPRLIKAYQSLPAKIQDKNKLLIVGQYGWGKDLAKFSRKNIFFTGYVKDKDLIDVYGSATVFVYPSLYEGFGLPPLEAMACGVPVITSNTSSLPEVVGNAAKLVDPYDTVAIAESIKKLLQSKELRQQMIKQGLVRAKHFSWENTAREMLKVYTQVANNEK